MTTQTPTHMSEGTGLLCPQCSTPIVIAEGVRIVQCANCQTRSLVQGEKGIRRWQVSRQTDRSSALQAVKGFFVGIRKAIGLRREAKVKELFLVYVPYWHVRSFVSGWIFGQVVTGSGKHKKTKPVEMEVEQVMTWNDAALDVSEFGVHRVTLSEQLFQPYDAERLHAEALVFEPTESATSTMKEAEETFQYRARSKQKNLKRTFFERLQYLRSQLSIVYYPLWVARYEYKKRHYQVVVDGRNGKVLYGKAPGNIFYRAAALVAGMCAGNFLLVNGTILAIQMGDLDDDALAIVAVPVLIGLGLIVAGYRAFRYGEEVEQIDEKAKKDRGKTTNNSWLDMGTQFLEDFT